MFSCILISMRGTSLDGPRPDTAWCMAKWLQRASDITRILCNGAALGGMGCSDGRLRSATAVTWRHILLMLAWVACTGTTTQLWSLCEARVEGYLSTCA